MEYRDTLSTLAEVAIALAGFSGIVSIFSSRGAGGWSVRDRTRLVKLLERAFAALFFCVTPLVAEFTPVEEPAIWRVGSIGFAIYLIYPIATLLRERSSASASGLSVAVGALYFAGDTICLALLVYSAVALGAAWPYVCAVLWLLAVGSIAFVRLLLGLLQDGAA